MNALCTLLNILIPFLHLASAQKATDSAWNGHTPPGTETPAIFHPYYVPLGAKGYNSSSPLIKYTGKWTDSYGRGYIDNCWHWTSQRNAAASFSFYGTGIEWFGKKSPSHGTANVYLDGRLLQAVDTYNVITYKQQRLFSRFGLNSRKHTLKIVNTGKSRRRENNGIIDIDAFVVTRGHAQHAPFEDDTPPLLSTLPGPMSSNVLVAADTHVLEAVSPSWTISQKGTTGVNAMQLAIISQTHAIIIDKVEHNPLTISGHPAWASLYNLDNHAVTALEVQSNSFCAGGSFLRNGTLLNVGGNPVIRGRTSSADFGDLDGLQSIRIFNPCTTPNTSTCRIYENHSRLRMASPRWYNTVLRISDGSVMILGGSKKGGWINNATVNNPTIEYFPPKSISGSNGLPIMLPFLVDTLNSNLFPIAFSLPDGTIFIAANNDAMIYDWQNNIERRLPSIPNGVRVTYPMTGTGLLLPLSAANNYTAEILLCGGSTIDDHKAGYMISSQDAASAQCSRLVLNDEGISSGWQVEQMPAPRTMPDAVLLPTGEVLIVNGAASGISGYSNVLNQVGASNADHPVMTPVLYNPSAPAGQRFSSEGLPTSSIPRLYHSVATLTPKGDIMIAGSNPNLDRSEIEYGTEYRVEWLSPPYMMAPRPAWKDEQLSKLEFGQTVMVQITAPDASGMIQVALMDLGYITHAVHANTRLVYLSCSVSIDGWLTITGPPDGNVYPPGPGFLYILVNGVPSEGLMVMIGDGVSPPVDESVLNNILTNTNPDQYERDHVANETKDSE